MAKSIRIDKAINLLRRLSKARHNGKRQLGQEALGIFRGIDGTASDDAVNELLRILSKHSPSTIINVSANILRSNKKGDFSGDDALSDSVHQLSRISNRMVATCCLNALKSMRKPLSLDANEREQYLNLLDWCRAEKSEDIILKTTVLTAFGYLSEVQWSESVFLSIPFSNRDAISVGSMMRCYLMNGKFDDVLSLYHHHETLHNDILHNLALRACADLDDSQSGKTIISGIIGNAHRMSAELRNAVLDFYGHFGDVANAQKMFNDIAISDRDILCIRAMMKCWINSGNSQSGIALYFETEPSLHDDVSHNLLIKALLNEGGDLQSAKHLIDINIDHQLPHSLELRNSLITFYGECGDIDTALRIFHSMSPREMDSVSIGAMMQCLIQNQRAKDALDIFKAPCGFEKCNDIVMALAVRACIQLNDEESGRQIIKQWRDGRISENDTAKVRTTAMVNAAIEFHGHCGDVDSAEKVFSEIFHDELCSLDSICIGSLMKCYVDHGVNDKALDLFQEADSLSLNNQITKMLALKACMQSDNLDFGWSILEKDCNILDCDTQWINTVLSFYGHFGLHQEVERLFRKIDAKSIDTYNAVMQALQSSKQYVKALRVFNECNLRKDAISFVLALTVCTEISDHAKGMDIISELDQQCDSVSNNLRVKNAMINFYGRFGDLSNAENVFRSIHSKARDVISFNSMMNCYFINQRYTNCLQLFETLSCGMDEHVSPDSVSRGIILRVISECPIALIFGEKMINGVEAMKYDAEWQLLLLHSIQDALRNTFGEKSMDEMCSVLQSRLISADESVDDLQAIQNALIFCLAETGNTECASKIVQSIEHDLGQSALSWLQFGSYLFRLWQH